MKSAQDQAFDEYCERLEKGTGLKVIRGHRFGTLERDMFLETATGFRPVKFGLLYVDQQDDEVIVGTITMLSLDELHEWSL